ncbi:unnamed protein product [Closterium sp. NIES-53]
MAALLAHPPLPANAPPNAYADPNLPYAMQQQQQQQQWFLTQNKSPATATFGSLLRTPVAPATTAIAYPGQWQCSPPLVHPNAPFPTPHASHMQVSPAPVNVRHGEISWALNAALTLSPPHVPAEQMSDFTRCDSNDLGALPFEASTQALNKQPTQTTGPGTVSPATPQPVAGDITPSPVIPSIPTGGQDPGPVGEPDDGSDDESLDILAPRALGARVSREEIDSMSALVRSLRRENLTLKNQVVTL